MSDYLTGGRCSLTSTPQLPENFALEAQIISEDNFSGRVTRYLILRDCQQQLFGLIINFCCDGNGYVVDYTYDLQSSLPGMLRHMHQDLSLEQVYTPPPSKLFRKEIAQAYFK